MDKIEQELQDMINRGSVEQKENWRGLIKEIPFIKFPSDWEIQIIPPFGGAVARFRVRKNNNEVSVYLDWYSKLGYMEYPYWEIHPGKDNDCDCFALNDIDQLIEGIKQSLETP